jgi:hypothetical protein
MRGDKQLNKGVSMNKAKLTALVFGFFSLSSQLLAAPEPTVMCPMVFRPATCTYENFSASGTNSCFARIALQKELKMHGIPFDPTLVRCVNTDFAAQRIARPVCGIVPTTTFCSVTVHDQQWQASAQSCDSPIPDLREQLKAAGIEDTSGLIVTCWRSQQDLEQEYTVAL